jgi:hypothetical protein
VSGAARCRVSQGWGSAGCGKHRPNQCRSTVHTTLWPLPAVPPHKLTKTRRNTAVHCCCAVARHCTVARPRSKVCPCTPCGCTKCYGIKTRGAAEMVSHDRHRHNVVAVPAKGLTPHRDMQNVDCRRGDSEVWDGAGNVHNSLGKKCVRLLVSDTFAGKHANSTWSRIGSRSKLRLLAPPP